MSRACWSSRRVGAAGGGPSRSSRARGESPPPPRAWRVRRRRTSGCTPAWVSRRKAPPSFCPARARRRWRLVTWRPPPRRAWAAACSTIRVSRGERGRRQGRGDPVPRASARAPWRARRVSPCPASRRAASPSWSRPSSRCSLPTQGWPIPGPGPRRRPGPPGRQGKTSRLGWGIPLSQTGLGGRGRGDGILSCRVAHRGGGPLQIGTTEPERAGFKVFCIEKLLSHREMCEKLIEKACPT